MGLCYQVMGFCVKALCLINFVIYDVHRTNSYLWLHTAPWDHLSGVFSSQGRGRWIWFTKYLHGLNMTFATPKCNNFSCVFFFPWMFSKQNRVNEVSHSWLTGGTVRITPVDILFFSILSPQGAALIRMLANFMGHSVFQRGLQVSNKLSMFSTFSLPLHLD